ncbi:SIR2 family protein [Roseomonas sp. 18066]|uniref:SIR2 family protein n=1 Tax=Roseomonas sp. 18066 TaxID=2681412 RepID=UPI0013573672|nr:SIR2 family protein [Roseomonas sp. 18066]
MSEVSNKIKEIMERNISSPFLFVGSGFSRRYLGLEDWSGLLRKFCAPIKDLGYYFSQSNGDLPLTASLMANDYNEWWWSSPDSKASRDEFGSLAKVKSDALKIEISKYIKEFSLETARTSAAGQEVSSLSEIQVDGIITTNWDSLLEELFPEYKVFIGQQELLFSNPQAIGEIYKIHGCSSAPQSLVLTSEDYKEFSDRNPYLAAKLVTIFVEHPIIFLGYSISDPHIRAIITSIAKCLPQEKIGRFQENLIFVQRADDGETAAIEKNTIQYDDFSVTLTVARVSDFNQIYAALTGNKRKIPARILRFFKEQMYELVHTPSGSENKLAVVDFEEIDSASEIEFVVGVGVAKKQIATEEKLNQKVESALTSKGYAGVSADDVFDDALLETSNFFAESLLESAFPGYGRSNRTFLPLFRYLKAAGIESEESLNSSKYEGAKKVYKKMKSAEYTLPSYARRYSREFSRLDTASIIEKSSSAQEALLMLPFQPKEEVNLAVLLKFLRENSFEVEPYRSSHRKLICRYDRLAFGF